jgi:uncharacterized protein (DUF2062 family)
MSMSRVARYYRNRMARLPGTPHSIAAGFAAGAAVSFTPLIGFHFLLGALVAYLLRGNLIASAIGTAVGNPWTFPFIWLVIYELGITVWPSETMSVPWADLSLTYLTNHIGEVLVPMLIGGMMISLVVFPVFYFLLRRMIAKLHERRFAKRVARRKQAVAG